MMPMGSPTYMSPEQIRSSGEVDERTDIWSLGCVLFELLTGTTAFDAPTLMQLSAAILEKEPTPLCTLLPDASPELEAVVARCLEKDVSKRFQNIAELAVALYPFAPRRARISAERCSYLLRDAGLPSVEIEIGSVAPPSIHSDRRATTVTSGISRVNTSTSAAVAPISSIPVDALRRPKRGLFVGLGLVAVIGAVALWQFGTKAEVTDAPAKGAERPQLAAAAPAPVVEPVVEAAPRADARPTSRKAAAAAAEQEEEASDEATASRSTTTARSPARPRPRAAPAPRPKPRAATSGGGTRKSDEPDVGY
jgi:serine/threonine-protein kinase